jgi:hypothetical protein
MVVLQVVRGATGALAVGRPAAARRRIILWTAPVMGVCFATVGIVPDRAGAFAMMITFGLVISVFRVLAASPRPAHTPAGTLGRVLGVHRVLCWGALPVGALGSGAIGSAFGLRSAFALAGATVVVSWLVLIPFPGPFAGRRPHDRRGAGTGPGGRSHQNMTGALRIDARNGRMPP